MKLNNKIAVVTGTVVSRHPELSSGQSVVSDRCEISIHVVVGSSVAAPGHEDLLAFAAIALPHIRDADRILIAIPEEERCRAATDEALQRLQGLRPRTCAGRRVVDQGHYPIVCGWQEIPDIARDW